ncbi:MAG: sn-glycerol-3-phosphate ABC transporter ATP-binding protein UgpC [Actinomycetota bacterium]|nr:sn-glycerol-3-phosphate ABC transporter ATP-binding protein UgpC [Actinomycetota bacterium]
MAEIVLEDVTKRYGDGTLAVESLDLSIEDGEFMVFVGPSGCGKTTALRMIAGLETITEGKLKIGDNVVNDMQPKDRDIAMVFQNYALYPHMSVRDNMAFGLKLAKTDKEEINQRVEEAAKVLGLEEYLDRKPRALSGGQRQRVAMGRAIVRKPQAFLMDEPLSNLDAKLRVQMRSEIARIQRDLEVTTVYVTHDQIEAMTMGDRVAVIKKGALQQVGTPTELFEHPVNLFVAGFIGSPSMNFAQTTVEETDGSLGVKFGDQMLTISEGAVEARPALKKHVGKEVVLGIRPQDFEDPEYAQESAEGTRLKVQLDLIEAVGTETMVHFKADAPVAITDDMKELAADIGEAEVHALERRAEEGTNEFTAVLDPRTKLRKGEDVELSVDTSRLHFFDPESSQGIYDQR